MLGRWAQRSIIFAQQVWAGSSSPVRMDLRSIAALRVALALTVLIDLAVRANDIAAHYGLKGVVRCTPWRELKAPFHADLFACQPSELWYYGHFVVHAALALCLLFGLYTRLATGLCWLLLMSLHHRNPLVLNAGDTLLRLLMMWSIFLPLGARWSWDARHRPTLHQGPTLLSPATLAYCLQVLVVYPLVVYGRRHNPYWWNGAALAQIVDVDMLATRLGVAMRDMPTLLRLSNHGTMFWEFAGPFFALLPVFGRGRLRTLTVFAFMALHLGIGLVINVGTFPLVSAAGWVAFLPAGFWERWARKWRALQADHSRVLGSLWRRRADSWFANGLASLLLVYVAAWNVQRSSVHQLDALFPDKLALVGRTLELEQSWALFANPPRNDGWFVLVGSLANGKQVDLFREGAQVDFARPDYVLENIPSRRFAKLLMRLRKRTYVKHRRRFVHHYAWAWNREAPCAQQVVHIELVFMAERGPHDAQKRVLWQHTPRTLRAECQTLRDSLHAAR